MEQSRVSRTFQFSLFPLFTLLLFSSASATSNSSYHKNMVRPYRVGIIDTFYPGDATFESEARRSRELMLHGGLDLDRDGLYEPYYHGDLVSLCALHPSVEIVPYVMSGKSPPKVEILEHLYGINLHLQEGGFLDAVVLAWESSTLISVFDEHLKEERAAQYKETLDRWAESDDSWKLTCEIIRQLESLVASGVEVLTIAGNSGPRMVNTYSFARGVTTVGATELGLKDYVAHNAFVDTRAQAAYVIRLVHDESGKPLGYDLTGSGAVDFPVQRLSSYQTRSRRKDNLPHYGLIQGSSYAAGAAVRRLAMATSSLQDPEPPSQRSSHSPFPR